MYDVLYLGPSFTMILSNYEVQKILPGKTTCLKDTQSNEQEQRVHKYCRFSEVLYKTQLILGILK